MVFIANVEIQLILYTYSVSCNLKLTYSVLHSQSCHL